MKQIMTIIVPCDGIQLGLVHDTERGRGSAYPNRVFVAQTKGNELVAWTLMSRSNTAMPSADGLYQQ